MPRGGGGCMRSAGGRAVVCGAPAGRVPALRRYFSSHFSDLAAYAPCLCWVWEPGIAVLWSCQRVVRCVTVFAGFTYLLIYLRQ